jgi:hypothetical protein
MKPEDYSLNISNLKKLMSQHQKKGQELFFDAFLITGKQQNKIIDKGSHADLSLISDHLNCCEPDKIRLEFFDSKEAVLCKFPRVFLLNTAIVEQNKSLVQPQFKGFGEVEINNIVDQRFRERQQKEEFEELKVQVNKLTKENTQQSELIEELESEKERLELELENKKQVRYYAGMLGDILESFGISKAKMKKPIAELMGFSDKEEPKKEIQETKEDTSGIVEDSETEVQTQSPNETPEQAKRREVITLIADYLKSTDNKTLAKLFSIFSEIEHDNTVATEIMTFLESKKQE